MAEEPGGVDDRRPGGEVRPRRRGPRRAVRPATNPRTDDSPDLATPWEAPPEGEDAQARWFREQRPPHWG